MRHHEDCRWSHSFPQCTCGLHEMQEELDAARARVVALEAALTTACELLESHHHGDCAKVIADREHSDGRRGCPGDNADCNCGIGALHTVLTGTP